ncbi:MAG: nucleotide exchange factor GrpE [Bifidobacteriaceae bacterium]|nr:nucleotide exchange factor GrpE [Bifidobacteriaceae bacterium]
MSGTPKGHDPAPDPGKDELDEAIETSQTELPAAELEGDAVIAAAELITARAELAERTQDLQRVQADYVNYRKRVDRDRAVAGELGRGEVLAALISVLDDIDAARTAGELTGPFAAVAEKLEATTGRFGMERYGEVGDAFDPTIHEALMHEVSPEPPAGASEESDAGPTVSLVMQPGYRIGQRVIRAARVGVVEAG